MVVRAVGPGLAAFGLASTLPDPNVAAVSRDGVIASNDNWHAADAGVFAAVGAFALPAGSSDAALVTPLAVGPYTTPVGANGGSGLALLEVYDGQVENTAVSLVNTSTRAFVGTGDGVLIPGFAVTGSGQMRLLVRAVGPTLADFGVEGALADPELTLFSGPTAIGANDNWGAAANAAEIAAASRQAGAFMLPPNSRDAAVLVSLRAGTYTARVAGVGDTTGTALVEIYVVP
jgi:hypothetical protein